MSRRNFSQPSLADAFVDAYSRVGGFLEDIAKTFEWEAFGVLMGRLRRDNQDGIRIASTQIPRCPSVASSEKLPGSMGWRGSE